MKANTRRLLMHVRHVDGTEHQVLGRAAAMVGFVVMYLDRIYVADAGEITFRWSGPNFNPSFKEHYPSMNTGDQSS